MTSLLLLAGRTVSRCVMFAYSYVSYYTSEEANNKSADHTADASSGLRLCYSHTSKADLSVTFHTNCIVAR